MSKIRKQVWNGILMLLSLGGLLLVAVTLYDMQTAEGIGLYFTFKMGAEDRKIYDLLSMGVSFAVFCLLLILPCLFYKRLGPKSFFRWFSACLAFLPVVSVAPVIHLADGLERVLPVFAAWGESAGEIIAGGETFPANMRDAFLDGLAQMAPALVMGLPLLILLCALEEKTFTDIRLEMGVGISLELILAILGVVFPILTPYCAFFFHYILLMWGFDLWEKVIDRYPGLNSWGMILFGGCFLRGIYRMLNVMNVYNL